MNQSPRLSEDIIRAYAEYLSFNGSTFNWQDESSDEGRRRVRARDEVDFAIFLDEDTAHDAIPRIIDLLSDDVLLDFGSGLLADWLRSDMENRVQWLERLAAVNVRVRIALRAAIE